jgi:hypothetical protein
MQGQPQDEATARATRLGYCLQGVVARCLRAARLGAEIHEDHAYAEGVIRPDVLVGPPAAPRVSVHVTSSDSRDSFRMKRWRYVCELFQLKSFRPAVHATNVFWGTPELYQPADVAFLGLLFDSTIDLRADPEAHRLYGVAQERSAAEPPALVAEELFRGASARFRNAFTAVRRALATPPKAQHNPLWTAPRRRGTNRLLDGRRTGWVRLLLRCLLLTEAEMAALKAHAAGRSEPPNLAVELGIVQCQVGIVSAWFVPPAFRLALAAGLVDSFRRAVLADARAARLAGEARDAGTAAWVGPVHRLLRGPPSLESAERLLHLGDDHPRLVALDGLLAAYGVSANSLESRWDEATCPTGVKNPVANLLSRTELVRRCFLPGGRDALARGVLHLWRQLEEWRQFEFRPEAEFRAAVAGYRRRCLFGQKMIRPAPFAARALFCEHGWEDGGKARFPFCTRRQGCAVATEFEYTYTKAGRRVLLKCLFGDSGAQHKAEEMAGRLLLLPFRLLEGGVEHRPPAATPLFIPEGEWPGPQLDLLASAGWEVVGLEGLPAYLGDKPCP